MEVLYLYFYFSDIFIQLQMSGIFSVLFGLEPWVTALVAPPFG